jgi:Pvc16 N-terminal domain
MVGIAKFGALAAAGLSIRDLLIRRIAEQIPDPPGPRPEVVLAGTNDFDDVGRSPGAIINFPAISLYCYRLTVDRETRPGWSAVSSVDGVPRLPLRMHFLLSAWDTTVVTELEFLGLAAQILESEPILTGAQLHSPEAWNAGETVQVVSDELGQDSMSEYFQAFSTKYRLSLPYVARVIVLEGRPEDTDEKVVTLAGRLETR